jgi:aspartyl aminopeptidase
MKPIAREFVCALLCVLVSEAALAQDGSVWETKRSGWQPLGASQRQEVFDFAEKYKAYLRAARTAFTSTREVIRTAHAAGFSDFTEAAQVKPGARPIINGRDRAVIEELDPVAGSIPGENGSVVAEVIRQVSARYNVKEEDFVSAELQLVPTAEPRDVGIDRGLVGAYGQDDRLSSYCAASALMDLKGTPRLTALAYLSNFEEVGSVNNTGASSEFLNSTYARLIGAQRGPTYNDLDLRTARRNAQVISADTNDGINPIFPETSEPSNAARLSYGVTIKRYGRGFDANSEFTAQIRGLLDQNQIPWQTQTPKVDVGGGGTIGGFMSAQDMEVIDLGVPLLSMHATFEMSSKVDVWNFYRFMLAFYRS